MLKILIFLHLKSHMNIRRNMQNVLPLILNLKCVNEITQV
jgi:hypothetical protein